jgi:hypothetical protein
LPASSPSALLFAGALYRDETAYRSALELLERTFGPIVFESLPIAWHSSHYREELGWPITRRFVLFRDPVRQDALAEIKLATCEIERGLSEEGRRRVNLDPGYLTAAKVVLASTKDYSHRIYLGNGVFAETTLYFRDGAFRGHLFTYPDFLNENVAGLFGEMRAWVRG